MAGLERAVRRRRNLEPRHELARWVQQAQTGSALSRPRWSAWGTLAAALIDYPFRPPETIASLTRADPRIGRPRGRVERTPPCRDASRAPTRTRGWRSAAIRRRTDSHSRFQATSGRSRRCRCTSRRSRPFTMNARQRRRDAAAGHPQRPRVHGPRRPRVAAVVRVHGGPTASASCTRATCSAPAIR